jgi:hypothetical protein
MTSGMIRRLIIVSRLLVACHDRERDRRNEGTKELEAQWQRSDTALCQRLVPAELQQRFMPNLVLSVAPKSVVGMVGCVFAPKGVAADGLAIAMAKTKGAEITFVCTPTITSAEALEQAKQTFGSAARAPGLGKLAFVWDTREVRFWDGDSDCSVDVVWSLGNDQALALAKALEKHLTAANSADVH